MKKILFGLLMCAVVQMPTYATQANRAMNSSQRRTMMNRTSTNININSNVNNNQSNGGVVNSIDVSVVSDDYNDEARSVCTANNVGIGNTFVWASRNCNTDSYSSMTEDVSSPQNNMCYVFVELKSTDNKVILSDIRGKYFPMGTRITCGEWVDKKALEKKILEGKKASRAWATVAGSIGGAGVGVGAMELFGNKLLSKAGVKSVEGQKALEGDELFISQLKVMKKSGDSRYSTIVSELKEIRDGCVANPIPECSNIDYNNILSELEEI